MKQPRSSRYALAASLGLFAMSLSTATVAGEVYQWKDARGVTQYSSTPPANGKYKVRTIKHNGSTAETVADPATTENPQCATLRKNIEVLKTPGALQLDTDGDGKTDKSVTDSERVSQLASAQAMLSRCTASAATPLRK